MSGISCLLFARPGRRARGCAPASPIPFRLAGCIMPAILVRRSPPPVEGRSPLIAYGRLRRRTSTFSDRPHRARPPRSTPSAAVASRTPPSQCRQRPAPQAGTRRLRRSSARSGARSPARPVFTLCGTAIHDWHDSHHVAAHAFSSSAAPPGRLAPDRAPCITRSGHARLAAARSPADSPARFSLVPRAGFSRRNGFTRSCVPSATAPSRSRSRPACQAGRAGADPPAR